MESEPTQERRALIVASPRAYDEWANIERTRDLLQQHGVTVDDTLPVNLLDGKPPLAEAWQARGINLVVAAGGDGTIGAVATHIAGSDLLLGILPLGTSNDFARSLRLPLDLEEACHMVANGRVLGVDLGSAQPALSAPHALQQAQEDPDWRPVQDGQGSAQAFFTHALTLGLNVTFARLATSATMRQRFGPFTYPVAALNMLSSAQPMDFTLTFHNPACSLAPEESENEIAPEQPYQYQALQIAVINSPVFGGHMEFALAGVELHDHLLDILVIENFDVRQLLAAAQAALAPSNHEHGWREAVSSRFPGIRHVKAQAITIETAEPTDVTLDGELRGRTPIRASAVARALRVLVPQPSNTAEHDELEEK